MKNGTAIFLIFLFTAPAGAIAQTSQQTLENWQHRTDSLITITERIDPVADSAYFGTLLDSLYWTIHVVDQWKEFKEWDKVCPVLFKQLTLTEKRFGIYHPHYQSAANDFFNGILKSREGPLSDFFRPTINVCINPAGNLRMPADSVRLTEIVNNICIISDILLNKGYNLVEDVPALKDEDVRAWKDLPFTDIAFPLLQAQQFAAKNIGVNSRAYTKTLQLLSVFAVKKKEPARARAYLVEMQAIEEKRVSKNHPDYCRALVYWGKYYQATARYDSAEAILTEAIRKCKAFPPETTWRMYSEAIGPLMEVYRSTGRYYDMAPLVDERYELAVKYNLEGLLADYFIRMPNDTDWQDYASTFHQLGRSFAYTVYDYPKAIEYYQKASKVVAQYCNYEPAALSWQISNGTKLGWAYMLSDRNDLADPLFEAAIQAGKKSGNAYHALKEAAQYYMDTNRPRRAEACLREVAELTEKQNGRESWALLQVWKQLARMYEEDGQFQRADSILQEAKKMVEHAAGKENAAYCQILNQLGGLYRITGNYSQAEACLLEAKSLVEKMIEGRPPGIYGIWGDLKQDKAQHVDYSDCLLRLGLVYTELGQFARADNLLETALRVRQEIQRRNPNFSQDRHIALLLNNIGFNFWDWGKDEDAERCFNESLALWEKIVGKKKADYIVPLHSLADWYFTEGRYAEAEPLYNEVSAFWAESGTKSQQQFLGMAQHYLAMLYENTGRPAQAEPLYRKAEAIFIASIGAENRYYTACAFSLGQFYARRGRYAEALAQLRRSNALEQQLLRRGSAHLSEGELQKLATRLQRSADLQASLALSQPENAADLPALLYDNTLFYKGFLLEIRLRLERTMRQADSVSARQYEAWKTVQRQLSLEFAKPIAAREDVVLLEERFNSLEKELTRQVAMLGQMQQQVNWQEVQKSIQPGEAVLEFVHFQVNFPKKTDSTMYAALLLRPGTEHPFFIPLFEEKSLDSLLHTQGERRADYVNQLYALSDRGARPLGKPQKSLYDLLWKPLEPHLSGVKTIHYAPSGLLHRLNLAAVPINLDSVLGDQYNLVELGSTRQLVIPATVKPAANDAVLFGDISYDADSTANITSGAISSTRGELSFAYTDSTLRVGSWSELRFTGREVASVEKTMQSAGLQTDIYLGYAATEEAFKAIGNSHGVTSSHPVTGSPRVLHIATHGYFFPDPRTTSARFQTSPTFDEPVFKLSDHPMIRSGLILAGGNHAWQTGKPLREGVEDGILTAYEISQMNLSNTELVVLSACETGLGDIQGNEGVYGLQRAFKIAGAKYLVMSLWQVPDQETSVFMTTFYKHWLEGKMAIPEAFRNTQKEMRERFLNPYLWAGFVLVE